MSDKIIIGYIRVSSNEQADDGTSLARQEQQIRVYCQLKGFKVPVILADEAKSGFKSNNRPAFKELLDLAKAGKVQTLIVYDLSRLSRSVRTTLEIIEDIINKQGIEFISLKQDLNTTSATGKAFLTIASVFNELYRNEISEKMKEFHKHKRANNEYANGIVPYGYKVINKNLVEDALEMANLKLMVELRAVKHYSYPLIAEQLKRLGILTKQGHADWAPITIKRIIDRYIKDNNQNLAA